MSNSLFLCDKDISNILRVSQATVTRSAKRTREDALSGATYIRVGGARRWNKRSVAEALGISVEEIDRIVG